MKDNREYYKLEDGRSTMDIIIDRLGIDGAIAFCEGNVIKYNQRKGKKTADPSEDEAKAYWYEKKAQELRLISKLVEAERKEKDIDVEVIIRCGLVDIRGSKEVIFKTIKNDPNKSYYLTKITLGNKVVFYEPTAANQPKISVVDGSFHIIFSSDITKKSLSAIEILNATAKQDGISIMGQYIKDSVRKYPSTKDDCFDGKEFNDGNGY